MKGLGWQSPEGETSQRRASGDALPPAVSPSDVRSPEGLTSPRRASGPRMPAARPPASSTDEDITPRERAYHEVGHERASRALGRRVHSITVIPNAARGTLGACYGQSPELPDPPPLRRAIPELAATIDDEVTILLAGPEAGAFECGQAPSEQPGAASDLAEAERLALLRCEHHEHEARLYLAWLRERARRILDVRLDEIHRIAAALLERGTLTGEECEAIARGEAA